MPAWPFAIVHVTRTTPRSSDAVPLSFRLAPASPLETASVV
jgi:hypothetical protein